MNFPIWDPPSLGGAMVIAGIAIVHVVIAHFAVGAGIFNAVSEWKARKTGDETLLRFVRDNSIFLIYLSFVAGAVTGVGIWFSIGVVAPEGTSYLIRVFFWAWAIEWIFFLVELVSGYVYYFTWDRISAKSHMIVGWIYAVSAFMSLVVINGILCFMITPGIWPSTESLWDAWMNPAFMPSLLLRFVSALSLAGIFVAIVVSKSKKYSKEERARIIKWGAKFLVPLAVMPLVAGWFFETLPEASQDLATGGAIAMSLMFAFGVVTSFLIALYAWFGLLKKSRDVTFEIAMLMLVVAFIATASMEFVREGIRKPYLIYGVMYSNGLLVTNTERLNQDGVLMHSEWIQPDTVNYKGDVARGEAVYRLECLRCHQIDGYNSMRILVRDWNEPLIINALDHLDQLKRFMPPFIGTDDEKKALASYLLTLTDNQPAVLDTPAYPDSSVAPR